MKIKFKLPTIPISKDNPKKSKIKTKKIHKKINVSNIIDSPTNIGSIAIATLMFLIVLTIFGSVSSALNTATISDAGLSFLNLTPLVLVGAAIIGIVGLSFKICDM